jgi:hypothetical protein
LHSYPLPSCLGLLSSGLALIGWKQIWFMWVLDSHHRPERSSSLTSPQGKQWFVFHLQKHIRIKQI